MAKEIYIFLDNNACKFYYMYFKFAEFKNKLFAIIEFSHYLVKMTNIKNRFHSSGHRTSLFLIKNNLNLMNIIFKET